MNKKRGEFKIVRPYHADMARKVKKIFALHKKGYSIRQIMKELGYKSPRSIHHHLTK